MACVELGMDCVLSGSYFKLGWVGRVGGDDGLYD